MNCINFNGTKIDTIHTNIQINRPKLVISGNTPQILTVQFSLL